MSRFRTGAGAGVDLDDVFDLYVQGDKVAPTGVTNDGVDLCERYAPLQFGAQAPPTAFSLAGRGNFNTLWAAKGTAVYTIVGLHGKVVYVGDQANTNQPSVSAAVTVAINSDGTWQAQASTSNGSVPVPAPNSGTWLPAGALAGDYEMRFEITHSGHPQRNVINGAPEFAACSVTRYATLSLPTIAANNSTERTAEARVVIRLRRIGAAVGSETTVDLTVHTAGYL